MEAMTFLDTQVAVWLSAGEVERIPKKARHRLERQPLAISPEALLEMRYLPEIVRLLDAPGLVSKELEASLGPTLSGEAFERIVLAAPRESWTRDPFDGIIVAQAHLESSPLVARNGSIRKHYRQAVWV